MQAPVDASRRRLVAGGVGLLAATGVLPASALAQELPPCKQTEEAGNWRLSGELWVNSDDVSLEARAIRSRLALHEKAAPETLTASPSDTSAAVEFDPDKNLISVNWPATSLRKALGFMIAVEDEASETWHRTLGDKKLPLDSVAAELVIDDAFHSRIQTTSLNRFSVAADALTAARKLRVDLVDVRGLVTRTSGAVIASMSTTLDGFAEIMSRRGRLATNIKSRESAGSCQRVDCFVTTACCHAVGLSDDCWELRTLRSFRDRVLAERPDGQEHVARYYAVAPGLVETVCADPRGRTLLLKTYALYILPSATAASLGFNRTAFAIYRRAVLSLKKTTGELAEAAPHHSRSTTSAIRQ